MAWTAFAPDRITTLAIADGAIHVTSEDGITTEIDASGKVKSSGKSAAPAAVEAAVAPKVTPELTKELVPGRVLKKIASANGLTALGYWGGTVQIVDGTGATKSLQVLQNDVCEMGWMNGKLIVGLADGAIVELEVK